MEVKAIRWVGVGTDRVSEMRAFATDVLGLRLVAQNGKDFVELAMAEWREAGALREPYRRRSGL